MTRDGVQAQYTSRRAEVEAAEVRARAQSFSSGAVAAVAVIAAIVLAFHARWAMVALSAAVAAIAARQWFPARAEAYRAWRLKRFYERALERMRGDWVGRGVAGEQFDDPEHAYAHDLNLFGEGSLFELLCIGRSGIGHRGLARSLMEPRKLEDSRARQEAVRELAARTDLREKTALLGPHEFSESNWETFAEWLESPAAEFPRWLRWILPMTAALLVLIALAGGTLIPWLVALRLAVPVLLFHAIIGEWHKDSVSKIIRAAAPLWGETQVLREGLRLLEEGNWESARLREIAERARGGAESVRKLERLLGRLTVRNNDVLYLPSLLLMVGTQLSMAIERWRRNHASKLRTWMEAWAEFESLQALACYAFENPQNVFPEFAEGAVQREARFDARALGHPLLPGDGCVRNDVSLNPGTRFYIVSGSNMAGKSTLLRAIGLNAVLAAAGAPVRAESLRLSPLRVCASIGVADSLLNGKSKFLAEVERLRLAIQLAEQAQAGAGAPVLFLIDEIFSGTNSPDRRTAAEAVVRTLVARGSIGALSTHDLALAEIAEDAALNGANVHMGSRGEGDPMDFDYRLKPGVTREANALAIARMAGVAGDAQDSAV